MRRPAHGATSRPPLARPGNGFGRPVRPRPGARWRNPAVLAGFCSWDPQALVVAEIDLTDDDAAVNV